MKKFDSIIGLSGMIFLIAALIWYSISKVWGLGQWILLALGIIGLIYFTYIWFSTGARQISSRSLKQGSNVLVQVLVMLAIVTMVAFITTRQHGRLDLTANNLYSLSDQTLKVLAGLEKDVKIIGFYKTAEKNSPKDLLDEYDYRSANISYELVDPDEKPDITKKYNVKAFGTVVVESGAKRESIEKLNEADLTNAILKVSRDQDKVIYFLSGHGERAISDDSPEGYQLAAEAIRKENYIVRDLNLVRRRGVPDSCNVLAIVYPRTSFFPGELDSVKKYLDDGGKVLLLADQEHQADIVAFMAQYNMKLGNDLVVDASGMGQLFGAGPGMPLVSKYDQEHPITKGFNVMTFFPYSSSITVDKQSGGFKVTSLLQTGPQSWAETDYASGQVSFDPEKEVRQPVTLAAVAEKDQPNGKSVLIAFGDSDFAKNGYFRNQGNADLFLNTVNYLAEEEDLISVRPKQVDDRRLTLTKADVSALFYLVVIAIPLLVIIVGVIIFFKRNR